MKQHVELIGIALPIAKRHMEASELNACADIWFPKYAKDNTLKINDNDNNNNNNNNVANDDEVDSAKIHKTRQ